MIRKHQPEAIIVNNTGLRHRGELGHPEIDSVTYERGLPMPINREGITKYVAAEMCQTMNQHWGIATNDFNYISPTEVIRNLCACRKVGANYLLNVGFSASGLIPKYEAATLLRVGQWVAKYVEPIYEAKPADCRCSNDDFLLQGKDSYYLFAHGLKRKGNANVTLGESGEEPRQIEGFYQPIHTIRWLDNGEMLKFVQDCRRGSLAIDCTGYPYGTDLVIRVAVIEVPTNKAQ